MLTRKKILVWLSVSFVLAFGIFFGKTNHALAAPTDTQVQQCESSLQFVDIADISCTMSGVGTVIFSDRDPTDNNPNYKAPNGVFCTAQDADGNNKSGELTLDAHLSADNLNLGDVGKTIKAHGILNYVKAGQSGCNYNANVFGVNVGSTGNIAILLQGGSDSAANLSSVNAGALSGKQYSRLHSHDPTNGNVLYSSADFDLTSCRGNVLAVDPTGAVAHEYALSKNGNAFSKYPDLAKMPTNSGCGVDDGNSNWGLGSGNFQISPAISNISPDAGGSGGTGGGNGTPVGAGQKCDTGKDCPQSGPNAHICQTPASGGTPDCFSNSANNSPKTCEQADTTLLGWIMCPILKGIDDTAGYLNGQIEAQLNFNAKAYLCGGNDAASCTQSDTYRGWSAIRNVATGLLVLVMLVMVISEAMGGQFLDAYTVRKVMPKLIVAVLAIQLSWPIAYWLIEISNDLGQGIASLFYAIFNQGVPITLGELFNGSYTGQGVGFVALIASGIAIGYLIFSSLALAIPVLFGIIIGIFVLIFRQILILLCVLTLPIALVLWILPGTERYWKMWSSNFTKLLLMFPLIMSLIVMGRVFAKLASGGHVNTFWSFVLVLIAYFGPYFFLPQTFKWGGSILAQAGQAGQKLNAKLSEKPKKFFQGRQQELSAQRKLDSANRYAKGETFGQMWRKDWKSKFKPNTYYKRPLDLLRAGDIDPTMAFPGMKNVHVRHRGAFIEKGRNTFKEEVGSYEVALNAKMENYSKGDRKKLLSDTFMNAYKNGRRGEMFAAAKLLAVDDGVQELKNIRDLLFAGGTDERTGVSFKGGQGDWWNDFSLSFKPEFKKASPLLDQGYESYVPGDRTKGTKLALEAKTQTQMDMLRFSSRRPEEMAAGSSESWQVFHDTARDFDKETGTTAGTDMYKWYYQTIMNSAASAQMAEGGREGYEKITGVPGSGTKSGPPSAPKPDIGSVLGIPKDKKPDV